MITYEKYAEIRSLKGMKDSDVAKKADIPQSTFSDWKKGKSRPKQDKMQRIAAALDMDYMAFIGPVGKFSSYNPNNPLLIETTSTKVEISERIFEYAKRIAQLTGSQQEELDNYLSYLESKGNKQ